ncbi:MAG: formate dehydrogenase accessory sulfurtransferase FdhD [Dehalococcoidia bacterium]|nr:MAG: formate dehydrogenase accessory sulfurtransferase FdhD [Dehalococcoidia bacterium]
MNKGKAEYEVDTINDGKRDRTSISIAQESPVTIMLDDTELVTLLCSPTDLNYLAIGYLYSEGFIRHKSEIERVIVDDRNGIVRVTTIKGKPIEQFNQYKRMITSGCGRGVSFYSEADIATQKIESQMQVSSIQIIQLVKEFQMGSQLYKETRGVHSAALSNENCIVIFREDIGRHNAIDKIFGKCILEDVATDEMMVITSGRISSEIVFKVAKRHTPIIISISAPTDLGVKTAEKLGITLVSSVRGTRMIVNTNVWRVN